MKTEYRKINVRDIKVLSPISECEQRAERNVQSYNNAKSQNQTEKCKLCELPNGMSHPVEREI